MYVSLHVVATMSVWIFFFFQDREIVWIAVMSKSHNYMCENYFCTFFGGYVNSMDWNGGIDYWTGLLEGRDDILCMQLAAGDSME